METAFGYTNGGAYVGEAVMRAARDARGRIKNRLQFEGQWTQVWKRCITQNQYRLSGCLEWRGQFL